MELDKSFVLTDQESVIRVTARCELDVPGMESRWRRDFPHQSIQAFGPTQPLAQVVLGPFSGVKLPGLWPWPTTESGVEIKEKFNVCLYSPSVLSWQVRGRALPLPLPLPLTLKRLHNRVWSRVGRLRTAWQNEKFVVKIVMETQKLKIAKSCKDQIKKHLP
jgi:hypothetical protein